MTKNAGLIVDKRVFCQGALEDILGIAPDRPQEQSRERLKNELSHIEEDLGSILKKCEGQIEKRASRLQNLIHAAGGEVCTLTPESRFLTGAGDKGIMDFGFTLDWTDGFPMLPGSSIKGSVRSWVEHWATNDELTVADTCDEKDIEEFYADIFGFGPQGDDPGFGGGVIFFDGIFTGATIARDVLTPHHKDFRQPAEGASVAPPADWDEPGPHWFLTVDANPDCRLVTGCAPSKAAAGEDDANVVVACAWLAAAAKATGLGAKTTEGWGRFALKQSR